MHVLVAARHAQVRKFVLWSQTSCTAPTPRTRTSSPSATRCAPRRKEPFFADKIEAEGEVHALRRAGRKGRS